MARPVSGKTLRGGTATCRMEMPKSRMDGAGMDVHGVGIHARQTHTGDRSPVTALRRLASTTALALLLAAPIATGGGVPALAQNAGDSFFGATPVNPAAQMLLEADELIYDEVNNTVAAVGNVQIAYDGYTLVADRVTYDRGTGRVIATGAVEIVEPKGNRVFAEEIDITDNFQDGFVSALRVETADNTRFAAQSAERRDGEISVFNEGVYTACEPCKEDPSKPPLWQIRARKVVINDVTKRVEYEDATFELFGRPIAYLPRFAHADPSIRRKSGFLFPTPDYSERLGFSVRGSYFWALAPNYDLTLSATAYSNQGFLGEAEWRHRTANGQYNLRVAGIDQQEPGDFDAGTIDAADTERMAVMSTGRFQINPRWQFGWNGLWQTDGNFARTYSLRDFDERKITNEIYLTGLSGKNHFDLRGKDYLIQDSELDQLAPVHFNGTDLYPGNELRQEQQATVLPVLDYSRVSDTPVAGGQLSFDMNVTQIGREKTDVANLDPGFGLTAADERYHGVAGHYGRASAELEWKASSIIGGALVTSSLSGRADGMWLDTDRLNTDYNPLTTNDQIWRVMPAAMMEIRYPLIASTSMASHIFEPIAQVIVRPDETQIGEFPNEDAQSFVFDATNLFERDKFSGFDRVEGGTRANLGFRYSASFGNGASINVVAGQSFHLHGQNSFAQRDLVNAGLDSGLETDKSDYVAAVDFDNGQGLTVGLGGRFDETTANLRRAEAGLRYIDQDFAFSTSYIYNNAQPNYGFDEDRHEVRGAASIRLTENFRIFGNAAFDIENSNLFSHGVGFAYDDSCTSFSIAYKESDNRYTGEAIERSINFRLSLRTIGDAGYKHTLNDIEDN